MTHSYISRLSAISTLFLVTTPFAPTLIHADDSTPSPTNIPANDPASTPTATAASTQPAPKKDAILQLSPFVVTAHSRGIIPLNGHFRFKRFSGTILTPVTISDTLLSTKTLADYGLKKGEHLIAIDDQRIVGMDKSALVRLWMETGDAGDTIRLTLQGTGEDATVFRQIILKRIAPPAPKK